MRAESIAMSVPLDPSLRSADAGTMHGSSRLGSWLTGLATFLVVAGIAWWATRSGALASDAVDPSIGRPWTTLQDRWGAPACSAGSARLQSRESAARRPKGKSSLVVPHAELVLVGATPAHGPGSMASNRVLVFTSDQTVRSFVRRVGAGELDAAGGETRIAIDRPREVHVVEIDAQGRIRSIRDIRPIFVTHLPR